MDLAFSQDRLPDDLEVEAGITITGLLDDS